VMDKRIGYGLDFKEALQKATDEALQTGTIVHFSLSTKDHLVTWGELRDDGWRIYTPSQDKHKKRLETCVS